LLRVEQQLAEKYQGFKKAADKKLGEDYQSDMKARDKASRAAEFKADMDFVKSGGGLTDTDRTAYDRVGNPAFSVDARKKLEKNRNYPVYRHPGIGDGMPDRPVPDKMDEDAVEESGLQAYLGKKKYGKEGMQALQKAGRDGASKEKMAKIRARHDKMDEADMEEGNEFSGELTKARAQGKDSFKVDGKTYPVKEGFPTVADAEKRMREKEGKGSKGKIEKTSSGLKHTRDYEADDDGMDGEGKPSRKEKRSSKRHRWWSQVQL
jgi:hypothetical protein